jgi:hypothetical protein
MMLHRRSFLTGLTASLIAAPAIVRAASLMPVRGIVMPVERLVGRVRVMAKYMAGDTIGGSCWHVFYAPIIGTGDHHVIKLEGVDHSPTQFQFDRCEYLEMGMADLSRDKPLLCQRA